MPNNVWNLILPASVMVCILGAILFLSQHYTLDGIKSRTVGDGQHGTARWATKKEIQRTFKHVPFRTTLWREGKERPKEQGLVLGSTGKKGRIVAMVDSDDIHCLMIGASGIGKTAFFLYPSAPVRAV